MDESQFFFQSTEQNLKFSDPAYWFLFLLISIVGLKKTKLIVQNLVLISKQLSYKYLNQDGQKEAS